MPDRLLPFWPVFASIVPMRRENNHFSKGGGCVCRKPRPFDLMKESRTGGHDGRAARLPFEAVTFAVQADQPTRG